VNVQMMFYLTQTYQQPLYAFSTEVCLVSSGT
jgi:hypothetical protein